jgi:hypothetical protein
MKLLRELLEQTMPEAKSEEDLLASIKDGKFILDGSKLKVSGRFNCSNKQLTSLTGAPKEVSGDFYCRLNTLTSLTGAPASVGRDFSCSKNALTSRQGIKKIITKINGTFYCRENPLKSHILGLLKIKGCKKVEKILNKYLPEGDLLDCQEELIDAGLDDYAQL